MCFVITGDPRLDQEYEQRYQQTSYIVPEVIKNFLVQFQKVINEQNLYEIQNAYENGYVPVSLGFVMFFLLMFHPFQVNVIASWCCPSRPGNTHTTTL